MSTTFSSVHTLPAHREVPAIALYTHDVLQLTVSSGAVVTSRRDGRNGGSKMDSKENVEILGHPMVNHTQH